MYTFRNLHSDILTDSGKRSCLPSENPCVNQPLEELCRTVQDGMLKIKQYITAHGIEHANEHLSNDLETILGSTDRYPVTIIRTLYFNYRDYDVYKILITLSTEHKLTLMSLSVRDTFLEHIPISQSIDDLHFIYYFAEMLARSEIDLPPGYYPTLEQGVAIVRSINLFLDEIRESPHGSTLLPSNKIDPFLPQDLNHLQSQRAIDWLPLVA